MASADAAGTAGGQHAYGILQQGAGLVDAYEAVYSTEMGCANRGLDITAEFNNGSQAAPDTHQPPQMPRGAL